MVAIPRSTTTPNTLSKDVKNCFNSIYNYFAFYFSHCVIHCVQYVSRPSLTKCERILWFSIIISFEVLCVHFAIPAIDRYYKKNSYVSLERDFYLWNTTFPASTICPMDRIDRDKFQTYFRNSVILEEDKELLFDFLEHLANSTYFNFDAFPLYDEKLDNILSDLSIIPNNYMELIYNLTSDYTQLSDEQYRVRNLFDLEEIHVRQILTEYGLCYLSNSYLNAKYSAHYLIFGEFSKSEELTKDIVEDPGISVLQGTYIDTDINYNFIGFEKPFDAYIHSPYDVLKVDNNFGRTELGLNYAAAVEEIRVDDTFRQASIQQRHCRFQTETNLTHFPIYTEKLCQQECRLHFVYRLCKCIPHFYPNRFGEAKPVCHYKVLRDCVGKYSDSILKLYNQDNPEEIIDCPCEPNCLDVVLNILRIEPIKAFEDLTGSIGILVMMEYYPTIRFKRQLMFTFSNLLVYIGSLAGFFMGFNVLAALEFIYFFTLRLFFKIFHKQITSNQL